jgi:hypothetical protein
MGLVKVGKLLEPCAMEQPQAPICGLMFFQLMAHSVGFMIHCWQKRV